VTESVLRIRVVAAVIRRGPQYLMCLRPQEKRHGGLWEFPGGKCEPGESDLDATTRELQEELGVRVTSVGDPLLIVADPGTRYDIVFLPTLIDGEPQPLEHDALEWHTPESLLLLPLAPSDALFVRSRLASGGLP
jgi:8-oxo-dGTP diphosphatase